MNLHYLLTYVSEQIQIFRRKVTPGNVSLHASVIVKRKTMDVDSSFLLGREVHTWWAALRWSV